jgi:predicted nuclease with TOPRIM domain
MEEARAAVEARDQAAMQALAQAEELAVALDARTAEAEDLKAILAERTAERDALGARVARLEADLSRLSGTREALSEIQRLLSVATR